MNASLWQLAGWTMIHSLWLGAAVALAGGFLRLACRRATPNTRYAISLATLTLLAATPIAAAAWLSVNGVPQLAATSPSPRYSGERLGEGQNDQGTWPSRNAGATNENPFLAPPLPGTDLSDLQSSTSQIIDLANPNSSPQPSGTWSGEGFAALPATPHAKVTTGNPSPTSSLSPSPFPPPPSSLQSPITSRLSSLIPHLPTLWLIGAPLTFTLLATGLVGSERLRRRATPLHAGPAFDACQRLRQTLTITRRVALAVCDDVAQPILVGIVRPLILLPTAALAGWTPEQLDMVLLHELAHVRRWDNLVNLLQRIVESLLFFHPAVWLVSRQVRRDREECCDAAVIRHTDRPEAYATLLIDIASRLRLSGSLSPTQSLTVASAMASHPLAGRIRRILNIEAEPMRITRRTLAATLLLPLLLAAALFYSGASAQAPPPSKGAEQPSTVASDDRAQGGSIGGRIPDATDSTSLNNANEPSKASARAKLIDDKLGEGAASVRTVYPIPPGTLVDPIELAKAIQSRHPVEISWAEHQQGIIVSAPQDVHERVAALIKKSAAKTAKFTDDTFKPVMAHNLVDGDNAPLVGGYGILEEFPTDADPSKLDAAIERLKAEKRSFSVEQSDNGSKRIVDQTPPPKKPTTKKPPTIEDNSSSYKQIRDLFTATDANPAVTVKYRAPPGVRKYVEDMFDGMEHDPYGPQISFHRVWSDDERTVEITAPTMAQGLYLDTVFNALSLESNVRRLENAQSAESPTVDAQDEISQLQNKIRNLESLVVKAQEELVNLEVYKDIIGQSGHPGAGELEAAIAAELDKDPTLNAEKQKLFELNTAYQTALASTKNPNSEEIKRLRATILQAETELAKHAQKLSKETRAKLSHIPNKAKEKVEAEYNARYKAAKDNLDEHQRELAAARTRLSQVAPTANASPDAGAHTDSNSSQADLSTVLAEAKSRLKRQLADLKRGAAEAEGIEAETAAASTLEAKVLEWEVMSRAQGPLRNQRDAAAGGTADEAPPSEAPFDNMKEFIVTFPPGSYTEDDYNRIRKSLEAERKFAVDSTPFTSLDLSAGQLPSLKVFVHDHWNPKPVWETSGDGKKTLRIVNDAGNPGSPNQGAAATEGSANDAQPTADASPNAVPLAHKPETPANNSANTPVDSASPAEQEAEKLRRLFQESASNEQITKFYTVPQGSRQELETGIGVAIGKFFDPKKPPFHLKWEPGEDALYVTAPALAHRGYFHVVFAAYKLGQFDYPPDTELPEYQAALTEVEKAQADAARAMEGLPPAHLPPAPFPTLENQKITDRAYKLLGLELEPLTPEELERVKKLGYNGGLRVAAFDPHKKNGIGLDALLVGLHVWPITDLQSLDAVLTREDLDDLSPLRFRTVVKASDSPLKQPEDRVISGRMPIDVEAFRAIQQSLPPTHPNAAQSPNGPIPPADSVPPVTVIQSPVSSISGPTKNHTRTTAYLKISFNRLPGAFNPALSPFGDAATRLTPQEIERQTMNCLSLVKNPAVMKAALNSFTPRDAQDLSQDQAVLWLLDRLSCTFPGDGEIMELKLEGGDAKEDSVLLQAVIDAFLAAMKASPDADPNAAATVPPGDLSPYTGRDANVAPAPAGTAYPEAFDAALEQSRKAGKPVVVHFLAHNSEPSQRFVDEVLANEQVVKFIDEHFIPITIYADDEPAFAKKFRVSRVPSNVFVFNSGTRTGGVAVQGTPAAYIAQLQQMDNIATNPANTAIQGEPIPATPPVPVADRPDGDNQSFERPPSHVEGLKLVKEFPATINRDELKAIVEGYRQEGNDVWVERVYASGAFRVLVAAKAGAGKPVAQQPTFLYDGKTFDQWRDLWKLELNPERRIEAINAMAAFSRAGRGDEALNAILDVAAEYDFSTIDPDDAEGKLAERIIKLFTDYPGAGAYQDPWLPIVLDRMQAAPDKWRPLVEILLYQCGPPNRMQFNGPPVMSAANVELLKKAASDERLNAKVLFLTTLNNVAAHDPDVIRMSKETLQSDDTKSSLNLLGGIRFANIDELPEQLEFLFAVEPATRQTAREILSRSVGPQGRDAVADKLLAILNDPNQSARHADAIRALAMFSKSAGPTAYGYGLSKDKKREVHDSLRRIVEEGPIELFVPATVASELFFDNPDQSRDNLNKSLTDERKKLLEESTQELADEKELLFKGTALGERRGF